MLFENCWISMQPIWVTGKIFKNPLLVKFHHVTIFVFRGVLGLLIQYFEARPLKV